MDKIKELTDFYMWMQENDYNHNIRARVENKAEMYLNGINGLCIGEVPPCKMLKFNTSQLFL